MFYLKKITHQNTQGLNNLYYCLWINFNYLNLNNHTLNISMIIFLSRFLLIILYLTPSLFLSSVFFCLFPLFYLCYLPIFCLCSLFAFLHGHVTTILTSREWCASNTWTGVLFQLAVKSRPHPHFDVMFPHPWRLSLLSFLSSSQHMSKYSCQHMSKYSDTEYFRQPTYIGIQ